MLDDIGNLLPSAGTASAQAETAQPPAGIGASGAVPQTSGNGGDASTAPAPDSPETGATKNPPPDDTNTSINANADTDVVNSNGKPDQIGSGQDAANSTNAASGASQDNLGTSTSRVDIYAYPREDKGYDFVAINSSNPKVIQGQFNTTTTDWATDIVRPGDYTISYRPHIEVKSGFAGIKQEVGALMSGNRSGNVNEHEGNLTLSNTNDWNTIRYEDGTHSDGVMIHPGHDKTTGEGGSSPGCFVTDKSTYEQLDQMVLENSNNNGQTYFHLQPR